MNYNKVTAKSMCECPELNDEDFKWSSLHLLHLDLYFPSSCVPGTWVGRNIWFTAHNQAG